MSKYKSYSCCNLLEYLDECHRSDNERINYAQYLLGMLECNSIKEMIEIYDKVLWKLIVMCYGDGDEKNVCETWYDMSHLSIEAKGFVEELNDFLNENIERMFFMQDNSDDLAIKCAINIRDSNNSSRIRHSVLANSLGRLSSVLDDLEYRRRVINDAPYYISPYNVDTNVYKPLYIKSIKLLIDSGFERSIKERAFESSNNINYNRHSKVFIYVIIGIISVLLFICLIYIFKDLMFTIILLLGFPFALRSFLK